MMDGRLPQRLGERLKRPLPGVMIGTRFEPSPTHGRRYDAVAADARRAAVLILLYPHEGRWHLPLTLRPAALPLHAGQISLPGGAIDPGESSDAAAVREFHEELGATDEPIELLGPLSPIYVEASNYRVEAWIAAAGRRPDFAPNPAEVAELLEVPLAHLLDRANFGCHPRTRHGLPYSAPHFAWGNHRIWGATCMILGELVTILEEPGLQQAI
jgi:8-oxo-dGTP pyrophosphatase MutT (NUDIX family)